MSNSMLPARDEGAEKDARKKRKKDAVRRRVRAAWIAFIGRIVAQFVGSAASIVLALVLVGKHQQPSAPAHQGASQPAGTSMPAGTPGQPGAVVVVLDLGNLPGDARQDLVAAINATLAQNRSLTTRPAKRLRGDGTSHPDLVVTRSLDSASELHK